MDAWTFNVSHQASFYITYSAEMPPDINISEPEINITKTISRLNSSLAVTVAVLLVFLFSPMILIGNSLVLVAMYRFKRLRTPSNYLILSLATSDLGIGMFMPVGMYLELGGGQNFISAGVCLFSYGIAINLCCASVLIVVAIAVDRFTSLAQPLRYANSITQTAVERHIIVLWGYSFLVGFTPLGYAMTQSADYSYSECSFGELVSKPVQLFMFCAVYGPSALILVVCYGYVYFIARGHARAISEIRLSVHSSQAHHKYGVTLALTTGMFLALWLPFQICMLMDIFLSTKTLSSWSEVYLALPILSNSAFNPWIYAYRNAELRAAVRRIIDDFLAVLGFTSRSHRASDPAVHSMAATAGDHASFINHVQRERHGCKTNPDFLLVPIAKPESSGLLSETDTVNKSHKEGSKALATNAPRILKGSKSMIESFVTYKESQVFVMQGVSCDISHGASMV